MIKIIGNDITRGGKKLGWTDGRHILDEHGTKLGYFENNEIYDQNAHKVAHIEGNRIFAHDGRQLHLDDSHDHVSGGTVSDLERAAIWLLIGD